MAHPTAGSAIFGRTVSSYRLNYLTAELSVGVGTIFPGLARRRVWPCSVNECLRGHGSEMWVARTNAFEGMLRMWVARTNAFEVMLWMVVARTNAFEVMLWMVVAC